MKRTISDKRKVTLMCGDDIDGPGGVAAVARTFRDNGMFNRMCIRYLSTYRGPGRLRQVEVFGRALLDAAHLMFRNRVAVAHLHTSSRGSFWRSAILAKIAESAGVPVILHIHSGAFSRFYWTECNPIMKLAVRRIIGLARYVICLTNSMAEDILRIQPTASIKIVGNPAKFPTNRPGARPPSKEILYLGRIFPEKGIADLISAMRAVVTEHPETHLTIAGPGNVNSLSELASNLGLANSISFVGSINGQPKQLLLEQVAAIVLPSWFEAFPMVILEAAAHGTPIIATQVGGIPEILTDKQQALLVPPRAPEAIATALCLTLGDPAAAHDRAQRCFEHLSRTFNADAIEQQLSALISSASCSRGARARASEA